MTGDLATAPNPTATLGGESLWSRIDKPDLLRTLVVALCAVATLAGLTGPWPAIPLVAVLGLVIGCWPIASEAWEDARRHRMSMELSMLIAIVAAAAIGEWVTALVITTFVLAAEILEDLSLDRGKDALTDLMSFLPQTVQIRRGDDIIEAPLTEALPEDVLVVPPGGRVPVDGTVVAGQTTVDQSRITGESLPVDITSGDPVYSGSVNQVGTVEVRAEKVGTESTYGQIIDAVREAQESEPPVQRLADRLAAWLVYLALAGAALTYLITRDVTATISVVVVAGACGIAAGTPLAALAAIARIARSGAFVKDGAHLETLSTVDTVAFDKTGTLTEGLPRVTTIRPRAGMDPDELLRLTATVESYSEHPLGRAVVAAARERGIALETPYEFEYLPGQGVRAVVDGHRVQAGTRTLVTNAPPDLDEGIATSIHVSIDDHWAGRIHLADTVRTEARVAIAALHRQGVRSIMITGDQENVARAIAADLGIDDVRAGLLPDQKLAAIDAEQAAGSTLAMIGDGVNDAPSLARADVGIAMGSGTQIAQDSADVVLISSDLDDLVHTIRVARRARRIVMVNFIGTIAVDLIGIGLAAAGLLSPIMAAFVHVGSETAFILNSARLIPGRTKH